MFSLPLSLGLMGSVAQTAAAYADVFSCGTDQKLPNPIPRRPDTLILAGDGRLFSPCRGTHTQEDREAREISLLMGALRSQMPEERWRAAQAVARMPKFLSTQFVITAQTEKMIFGTGLPLEDNLGDLVKSASVVGACRSAETFGALEAPLRWQPGRLFQLLLDTSPEVQKEAAYAIGTRLAVAGRQPDVYTAAFREIQSCLLRQTPRLGDDVRSLLLEAIGIAAYANDEQRATAEAFLLEQSRGSTEKILGATRGLEGLVRQNPRRPIQSETRDRLRELAVLGQVAGQPVAYDPNTTIRMLAVQALMTAGDTDLLTIQRAARDDDWQVRRLVAGRLDLSIEAHAELGAALARDSALQVRHDLIPALGRLATRTGKCEPIAAFFKDPSPLVAMRAMDAVTATCSDLEAVAAQLIAAADSLKEPASGVGQAEWHLPARALTALARVKPEEARSRLDVAAKHGVWQVRATAAAVAATVRDEVIAIALARDSHWNVRTAALDALSRMKSAAVVPEAIAALQDGSDFQLLMTAARVLRGLPADAKPDATEALLGALRRLTENANDMSRDPRVAIVERLGETMPAERSTDLLNYVPDFDDAVGAMAARSFTALVGSAPADVAKRRRYPLQPTEQQLGALPKTAEIQLESGTVQLRLLSDVAPVTIARFAELAASGVV